MTAPNYRLSIDKVRQARQIIDPVFLNTPQYINDSLSELLDLRLILKMETLNPIRCFKGRGADLLVAGAAPGSRLTCASAGNFGQAMAYSCRKRDISLTVYASTKASPFKLDRMRALGADVVQFGDDFDSAKLEARKWASEKNIRFVEDSLDIETLEGAATIGLELLEFPEPIDTVLVALGNGALFNGVARVIKARRPAVRLVAIQARGASAMIDSWRSEQIISYDSVDTIADGIAVRTPVPQALDDMKGLVDEALLVDDPTIIRAMQMIHEHTGLVTEPSGAVGLAAMLENPKRFSGQSVATILCGSNISGEQMKQWLV